MILARMRSPGSSRSPCFGVYVGARPFGAAGTHVVFLVPLLVNPFLLLGPGGVATACPPLPPDFRRPSTTLRAGRTGRNPSKGTSLMKWDWLPCRYTGPLFKMTLIKSFRMSAGCTGKWFGRKLQTRAVSKLNPREITPCGTKTANTLCQGPVAGKCKLHRKLQWESRGVETGGMGTDDVAAGCIRDLGRPVKPELGTGNKATEARQAGTAADDRCCRRRAGLQSLRGDFHSGWAVRGFETHRRVPA